MNIKLTNEKASVKFCTVNILPELSLSNISIVELDNATKTVGSKKFDQIVVNTHIIVIIANIFGAFMLIYSPCFHYGVS